MCLSWLDGDLNIFPFSFSKKKRVLYYSEISGSQCATLQLQSALLLAYSAASRSPSLQANAGTGRRSERWHPSEGREGHRWLELQIQLPEAAPCRVEDFFWRIASEPVFFPSLLLTTAHVISIPVCLDLLILILGLQDLDQWKCRWDPPPPKLLEKKCLQLLCVMLLPLEHFIIISYSFYF